ncbi:MAG: GNAT family N-acetyltransferase [Anaerolineaceae bacterium]
MYELPVCSYFLAQPIFRNFPQAILPAAILEGYHPGKVYVDQPDEPRVAMIWSTVGYYFLAGQPSAIRDIGILQKILTENFIPASKKMGENGFILATSGTEWKEYIPGIMGDRDAKIIFRQPFRFQYCIFKESKHWLASLPSGFVLKKIDADLLQIITLPSSWSSIEAFLTNGSGYALVNEGKIISSCFSVFRSGTGIEMDVQTTPEYRGKGYAMITSSAVIEACIQLGLQPNWECFWDNLASIGLAEALGFEKLSPYPVFYWEE